MGGVELMIVLVVLTVTCLYLFQQYDASEKDLASRRVAFEKKKEKTEREIENREKSCEALQGKIAELKQRIEKLEKELREAGVAPPSGTVEEAE